MSYILLLTINLIIVFIAWVILYSKIKKNSIPSRIEEYTREVERLIIELNRALEDVVSISEERIEELKSLIKKAEKVIGRSNRGLRNKETPEVKTRSGQNKKPVSDKPKKESKGVVVEKNRENSLSSDKPQIDTNKNSIDIGPDSNSLMEKTKHLAVMGYSRDEIAKALGITPGEVDFLRSISIRKT